MLFSQPPMVLKRAITLPNPLVNPFDEFKNTKIKDTFRVFKNKTPSKGTSFRVRYAHWLHMGRSHGDRYFYAFFFPFGVAGVFNYYVSKGRKERIANGIQEPFFKELLGSLYDRMKEPDWKYYP
ncbi:hypothetical protein ROZALSC1DRAFT_27225 [Rozella allomycis CSF55]|uniref:Uncharacterized protein n=1 Tax=Rozella allomycis (strain CSF55) TaxID=988480 RepID=A0A075AZU1_ROZAC|nr:hypothetical protein O9G_003276 [Rozella allomycis CSF55]RKP21358.1 hypothetical protein ROZALSC1DRAFT_27225 [Rozella allomycis CSF55]|eukprot:EPZ35793.1 hypothetical protein O9G_003276 [Rozella allomycis CSF55]